MSMEAPSSVAELGDGGRLIVSNGGSAVDMLRDFGAQGTMLPWRDVLHDGPVPDLPLQELSEVRAQFISSQGWAPLDEARAQFRERDRELLAAGQFEEIVLWFEHDLYDQLQLL